MKIVVWNLKEGQGKTILSLAIAMLEGFYIITNDVHSPINDVLGEDKAMRMGMRDSLPPNSSRNQFDLRLWKLS